MSSMQTGKSSNTSVTEGALGEQGLPALVSPLLALEDAGCLSRSGAIFIRVDLLAMTLSGRSTK